MRDTDTEQLTAAIVNELTATRKAKGLSHETVATATGLSRAGISFIESHRNSPTLANCLKIAKALGVKLGDVINGLDK